MKRKIPGYVNYLFFPLFAEFREVTHEQLFWACSELHQVVTKQPVTGKGKVFQGQGESRHSDLPGGAWLRWAGLKEALEPDDP